MSWNEIYRAPLSKADSKRDTPSGLWIKCTRCKHTIFTDDFETNLRVCTHCHYHSPLPAWKRIWQFCDEGSFVEHDAGLEASDPLEFKDQKTYKDRLAQTQNRTGLKDAMVAGSALLQGIPIELAVFDFAFMGGSMGSVVGEKITRTFLRAADRGHPAIVFSTSGGARMHEGILSLMQMAKTCAALSLLRDKGLPMISVMTHPTTGGVAASYAMLGDLNIAEPEALIGFAGPRVIAQTIGETLPEGFQSSEYLMSHGMLDMICHRDALRGTIGQILDILVKK